MTKLLSLRAICNYKSPQKFSTAKPCKRKPKFKSKFKPKFSKFRKAHKKFSKSLQTHNLTKPAKIQRTRNSKPQSPKSSKSLSKVQKFSILAKVRKPSHKIQQVLQRSQKNPARQQNPQKQTPLKLKT